MQCNGVEWNGIDGIDGMQCSGVECNGVDGMQCSGVEWNGVDGMQCSGVEWNGIDGMKCIGVECPRKKKDLLFFGQFDNFHFSKVAHFVFCLRGAFENGLKKKACHKISIFEKCVFTVVF